MLGLPFEFDRASLFDRMFHSLTEPMQDWLAAHPLWHWFFSHPLWLFGLIVLGLFLFAGLFGAIARLTETLWLAILQAPFKLLQWLVLSLIKFMGLLFTAKARSPQKPSASIVTAQAQRLTVILTRLEAMHQEQEALMQEVREILAAPAAGSPTVHPAIHPAIHPADTPDPDRLLPSAAAPLPAADHAVKLIGSTSQQQ